MIRSEGVNVNVAADVNVATSASGHTSQTQTIRIVQGTDATAQRSKNDTEEDENG